MEANSKDLIACLGFISTIEPTEADIAICVGFQRKLRMPALREKLAQLQGRLFGRHIPVQQAATGIILISHPVGTEFKIMGLLADLYGDTGAICHFYAEITLAVALDIPGNAAVNRFLVGILSGHQNIAFSWAESMGHIFKERSGYRWGRRYGPGHIPWTNPGHGRLRLWDRF